METEKLGALVMEMIERLSAQYADVDAVIRDVVIVAEVDVDDRVVIHAVGSDPRHYVQKALLSEGLDVYDALSMEPEFEGDE